MKCILCFCIGFLLLASCEDDPVGPDGNDKSSDVTGGKDTLIVEPVVPPPAPILSAPADGVEREGDVHFSWVGDTAYEEYMLEIYRGNSAEDELVRLLPLQVCNCEVQDLDGGEQYAWRVGGLWSDTTIWSSVRTFSIAEPETGYTRCTLTFRGLNCIADFNRTYQMYSHYESYSGTTIAEQNASILFVSDSTADKAFAVIEGDGGIDLARHWGEGRSLLVGMNPANDAISAIKFSHGEYLSEQHAGHGYSSSFEFSFEGKYLSVSPSESGVYVIRDTTLLHTHFTYTYKESSSSWNLGESRSYSARYKGIQFADSTMIELRFE